MELDTFHQKLKSDFVIWLQNPNDQTKEAMNAHQCPGDEFCNQCTYIFCPHDEPLDNHHDGCPSCWNMSDVEWKTAVANKHGVTAEVPKGKPSWQSHSWAQIFQNEQGYWFGTIAGWDLSAHIGNGFKGRNVNLLRSDGEFLAYGSYNPEWENSLEIRPK